MSEHLPPSAVVERIIGRPETIGTAIGVDAKLAYKWRFGAKFRDAGDIPSARHMRALLAYARARGLPLMADDLIYGANAADIEARLAQTNAPATPVAGDACGAELLPAPALNLAGEASPAAFLAVQADEPPVGGWGGSAVSCSVLPNAGAEPGGSAPATCPNQQPMQGAA